MSPSASFIRLSQFDRALLRLQEALGLPDDPVVRDACIQRFEFTFETAWRAVQSDALAEGVECVSPRSCFRAAFRMGVLEHDEPLWMKMVEDRNRTTHVYDEDISIEIRGALPSYTGLFAQLLGKLQDREKIRQGEKQTGAE